ncbi:MAG: hypothetical protein ABR540_10670 [Acidimicrobiales bacterium]
MALAAYPLAHAGKPRPGIGTSDAIGRDGTNHLELTCRGEGAVNMPVTLVLSVNGARVGTATDPAGLPPRRVGVVLASRAAGVQVLFDNFLIRPL